MSRRWSPIERTLRLEHGQLIAGVDEVGRGPLAGPVVACAVIMPPDQRAIRGVDDSKRLPESERERLAIRIRDTALALGIGAASVREIDTYNIYHASTRAIRRALNRLSVAPNHVLIDGLPIRTLGVTHTAVVHGDARCYAIACASIVAKVLRDALMRRLARRYPVYGWDHNVGYATAEHCAVIDAHGATPHHRTSFRVHQLELDLAETSESLADGPSQNPDLTGLREDVHTVIADDAPPLLA
jgi:ribonuclease HII